MTEKKARFITFEGIEGAGKSTQLPLIARWLEAQGRTVLITREPGGTVLGEKIRALLLQDSMHALTEVLLVFAARAEHLKMVIEPALDQGIWVLCDRFTEASYAYQGGGRQLGFEKIAVLESWLQESLQPDMTCWFDLPITLGLSRIKNRSCSDRFEQEGQDFFERVAKSYEMRAQKFPLRFHRIDATHSIEDISKDLQQALSAWTN